MAMAQTQMAQYEAQHASYDWHAMSANRCQPLQVRLDI